MPLTLGLVFFTPYCLDSAGFGQGSARHACMCVGINVCSISEG